MTQESLVELETRLAFQEDAIDALNATVVRLERRLDTLERVNRALSEQLSTLSDALASAPGPEPPPPHY